MLTTVPVTITLLTSSGAAIAGARVTATLTQMDTAALSGLVYPREVSATSNHDGEAVLHLWPNTAGVTGSQYRFRATDPISGRKLIDQLATVPEHPVNLRDILMLPAPTKKPYDEASIAAIQQARAEAVAAANEASGYLGTVQQDAQLATQKASESGGHAQTAAEQAEAAGLSNQQAGQAATLAGQKANLAAQHESNANEAAGTAEDAAQLATTKAQQAEQSEMATSQFAQQAGLSAQQAVIARQGVEDLRDQTGQLASQAVLASNTAQEALTRANEEADKAGLRASHALNYRDAANQAKVAAQEYRESARRWAQEHEDTPVLNEDGEVPQYSAMHWAKKALRAYIGGAIDDTKITTDNVWSAFKTNDQINVRETEIRNDMNAADLQLQQNIDTEQQARIDADDLLQQNLDAETQARTTAVNLLQSNIDAEEQARTTADNQLQQNLDTEAQARQDADAGIQLQITNLEAYAENTYYKKEGGHIGGDVSIAGNLTVQGETVQVDSRISTADRLIIVNNGEVGAGVTGGFAGLDVDRGIAENYEFGFSEATGLFELGKKGDRQPAMTREATPADGKVLKWSAANKRAQASDLTWEEVTEKPDLATQQQFSSLLTGLKDSFVSGKQSIDAVS